MTLYGTVGLGNCRDVSNFIPDKSWLTGIGTRVFRHPRRACVSPAGGLMLRPFGVDRKVFVLHHPPLL